MLIKWVDHMEQSVIFNNQFFNPYQKVDSS
jgi:hypothetical protein